MKQVFKSRWESDICEACGKEHLQASLWVYSHDNDEINNGWWVCIDCFTIHRENGNDF